MSWGMGPAVIRSTGADNSFPGALEHREGDLCARGPGLGSGPRMSCTEGWSALSPELLSDLLLQEALLLALHPQLIVRGPTQLETQVGGG